MKLLLSLGGGVALSLLILGVFGSGSASAAACAPGNHWIDTCAAGTDSMPATQAQVAIDIDDDCVKDINLVFYGPVDKITRSSPLDDSIQFPGLRPNDAHLDVIDTEIVEMELVAGVATMRVGTGTPGINAAVPQSLGAIGEQPGDAALADSFFEVFFEIIGIGPYYNQTALLIEAVIDQVPPDPVYVHPSSLCLDLFDAPVGGNDTGVNLVAAEHDTDPVAPPPPPTPVSVGGTAELLPGGDGPDAFDTEAGGLSFGLYAALAGGLAAVVALAAGGWHARRRWMR